MRTNLGHVLIALVAIIGGVSIFIATLWLTADRSGRASTVFNDQRSIEFAYRQVAIACLLLLEIALGAFILQRVW
jgi:hypothetical protein